MSKILVYPSGKFIWRNKEFRCAIGKNGVSENKQEGDGTTPAGCFPLRQVLYRPDRLDPLKTSLPVYAIDKNDGWCDDLTKPEYNRLIKLPASGSSELLWREDNLYDLVVVIGYNDAPPIPGKGSAIFMHIAKPNYAPTAGCVALSLADLQEIIKDCDKETEICIQADS